MYRALREEVGSALSAVLETLDVPTDDLGLEDPPENVDAVLASSVAFRLAGVLEQAPQAIAEEIADHVDADSLSYVDSVATAGPYVNFYPSRRYFADTLAAAADPDYGRLESRNERAVVEHTSANPTGPVHVGRARNPIIGDAIARIMEFGGYEVERHYYVNDAGRQMAVFTWAYETFDESDLDSPARDKSDYEFVRYYRKGNAYLDNADEAAVETAEAEIEEIMQGLEQGDEATYERVNAVVTPVLAGMRESLARLPATFDEFVRETGFIRDGSTQELISRLQDLPQSRIEEDAWILDLESKGLDNELVFVRSDGTSLYITRDLAHHEWKFGQFDRAVTVLGEDHELQAEQLRATLELLGHDTEQLDQVLYSYVNLPEGKMSTRRGTGIDLDDLLDEAIDRARKEVETRLDSRLRGDELTETDIDRIAEQVGIGAVRYDIIAKQPSKGITFEWERALDFDAQSAPYLQYVHARCSGILAEAAHDPPSHPNGDVLTHEAEEQLLKVIAAFPAVIEEAATDLEPHRIATYAREFAETFNGFYRECRVLDESLPDERQAARLALVASAKHTIANTLHVLGIAAPESM